MIMSIVRDRFVSEQRMEARDCQSGGRGRGRGAHTPALPSCRSVRTSSSPIQNLPKQIRQKRREQLKNNYRVTEKQLCYFNRGYLKGNTTTVSPDFNNKIPIESAAQSQKRVARREFHQTIGRTEGSFFSRHSTSLSVFSTPPLGKGLTHGRQ
jgi:hypothetical protein